MTTSISAIVKLILQVAETPIPAAGDVTPSNGSVVTHDGFNVVFSPLNSGSTPPALQCAFFQLPLVAGAATLDLTALAGTFATVNGTGQKIRAILFEALATNAAGIVVQPGVSNPHPCFGSASKTTLLPGQAELHWLADGDTAIGSTSKTLGFTGTGTDALDIAIILG